MNVTALLSTTRSMLADEISAGSPDSRDYLVSDDLLALYFTAGEEEFCRKTGFIIDSVDTSHCAFNTVVDQSHYEISDKIIEVRELRYDGSLLKPSSLVGYDLVTESSTPLVYDPAQGYRTVVLYPAPSEVKTVSMVVWRLPDRSLRSAAPNMSPEVPSEFHLALCHYACDKVYSHQDEELQDSQAALKHRSLFQQYVTEGKRAMDRLNHSSSLHQHLGIGSFGWSW